MTNVRALSLGMAVASLVAGAVAALLIWLLFGMTHQKSPDQLAFTPTKSVASASCESLQKICPLLAADLEVLSAVSRADFRNFEKLILFALIGTLPWGALSGACFLYIYAQVRAKRGT